MKVDPLRIDGAAHRGDDDVAGEAGERGDLGQLRPGGRCRLGGIADGRCRSRWRRRRSNRRRCGRCSASLVLGNGFGKLPDQPRKLLDLGGQRLRRRRRLVGDAFELAFHGAEAAAEFGDLAGDVARPAGKPGYLIVDLGAVGFAAGDRVIDRQRGQDAKRAQGRIGERKTEAEKQHRAQRRGDEHHAQCGKNGADAHHADPMAELIRVRAVSVSTRLAPPQVRPACGEGLAQAMARMTRPTFSNISPISASLAISGGAIASVSPVIRITRSSS